MTLARKLKVLQEFGAGVVLSDMLAVNIRIPFTSRYRDRVILGWLGEHLGHVVTRYQSEEALPPSSDTTPPPVWSMWLQGEDNMPEIIKLCISSSSHHCNSHPFRLITWDNFSDYITLPGYILERFRDGSMMTAHLSDIARIYLLANYGGLWLDASILTAGPIPEEIFTYDYCTIRRKTDTKCRNVSLLRWTTYLQAAKKGNILCRFVLDALLEYWKNYDTFIDYVMTDYIFALAYREIPSCRKLIDDVPMNNPAVENLRPLLNSEYNPELYEGLLSTTTFFKLTYKDKFFRDIEGRETFYGHLIKELS